MNQYLKLITLLSVILINQTSWAQTTIAKEQIEDAFLRKTGGSLFGDVIAATSTISAATLDLFSPDGLFQIAEQPPYAVIRSSRDLLLDPTNNGTADAVIVPATVIRFIDGEGDKIQFFSHSYKIGVSEFDLDITSDRNIKFHSDTVPDLMMILGDQGDVVVKEDIVAGGDIQTGGAFGFTQNTLGDKLVLYATQYKIGVSANAVDFYSDRDFKWHSDQTSDAMTLDADTGKLSLSGPLQLPVLSTLPSGAVGQLIYLDHPSDDNQDGVYIYLSTGWQKL